MVMILFLFDSPAFIEILGHFPRQLYVNGCWAVSALPNNGVDNLDGLGNGPEGYRAGNGVSCFMVQRGKQMRLILTVMALKMIPSRRTGFIIVHPPFQEGYHFIAGFD